MSLATEEEAEAEPRRAAEPEADEGLDEAGQGQASSRTRVLRTLGRILWQGVGIGSLLLVLAVAVLTIGIPKVIGAVPITVLSPSMSPEIPTGSLNIVKPTLQLDPDTNIRTLDPTEIRKANKVDDLRIGDVIAFQPKSGDSTIVMHRIVQVTVHGADGGRSFVTQGDNNAAADDPIEDFQVRGKVLYHLEYLGYVNTWVNNGDRHSIAVIAIVALGYTWAASLIYRAIRNRPRRRAKVAAAADADADSETPESELAEAARP